MRLTFTLIADIEAKLEAGEGLQPILAALDKEQQAELITELYCRGNVNVGRISLDDGGALADGGFLAAGCSKVNTAEIVDIERLAEASYSGFIDGDRQSLLSVPKSLRDKVAELVLKLHHVDLRRHVAKTDSANFAETSPGASSDMERGLSRPDTLGFAF